VKFVFEDGHIIPLTVGEFHENWYGDCHTLFVDINEFVPTFSSNLEKF
jgi:hypothetical protein